MGDVNFSVADGVTHNWSAEYARRLVDEMADKHNSDISDLHNELDVETATRESAIGAINGSIDEITDQLSSLSSKHDTDIAKIKNTFASTEHAGLIKLGKDGTGENKSGLVVDSSDGTCNVYCDEAYGTVRTGGRVATAPATTSDIDGRAQTHKPITPSTLEYAVNSIVGSDISSAKSNISTIQTKINELSSAQGNLARLLAELETSKIKIANDIPQNHAEDLLVEETGIYIDSAAKTHDCGVIGPGILLVFADDNDVDVYRFYLSHGIGLYVHTGAEWILLNGETSDPIIDEKINSLELASQQNSESIDDINAQLSSLSSSNSQLATRLSEVELSKMPIYTALPVDHTEDLLVEETGIYIDSAAKTHDCGVIGPGILLVFADDNDVDVYRFYLSHGIGLYVHTGAEWILQNKEKKYDTKPVKIGEWVDGVKGVYRYVFGYSLSSNAAVVSETSLYTILQEVTKDQNSVFVVNCNAFLRMGGVGEVYDGCCIDDYYVPLSGYGFDTSGMPSDYATHFDSFSGYIDFVTAATNLK